MDRLHALTPQMREHPVAAIMPSITLESELQAIITQDGAWLAIPFYTEAFSFVEATLPHVTCPLVFANGDYNPLNVLASAGVFTDRVANMAQERWPT